MDISPRLEPGSPVINAYGGGGFRIGGARHDGSLVVTAERVIAWPQSRFSAAAEENLLAILDQEPGIEVLLIGCGTGVVRLSPLFAAALSRRSIAGDGMDTGAACRTFNILLQEGRRAAAALIAVP